ncbi:hypothetical protein [Pelosinus propionicus]|uniref:Uncharacterized protein n=1 Tax=Pelosinus propionicus DSM 13327 TaxID=1123291 RepID=A0A1I4P1L4_9FIRM|nr:hypothetical protein [Pelosinus propionicus]SFM21536.1 hypothetical protein SAMN04490355_10568 [Pelosinus propionicus DSM 13327]
MLCRCYVDVIHGKEVPVYNTDPIITQDAEGNDIIQEAGTVPVGTTYDLSAIPRPYVSITEAEHVDWMANQSTRKIDIKTKKLIEYTPPEPAPVIITPSVSQDLADVWEAIFALSSEKGGE